MWNLIKSDTGELVHKRETDSEILNPNLFLTRWKYGEGDK